jgi:hypothetical protein
MSLSLFFPLILAYMAKAGTGADTTEHYLQTRFDYVYTMMLGYGLVFLLPCLIGIIAAILFFIERDCDTSKNLRTIPVTNTQLIMAKISMLFIFSIAFCLTSTLSVALFCKLFHVGMVYGMTYKIFMSLIFGVLIVAASLPIVFLIICFNKSFLLSILLAFFYSIFNWDILSRLPKCTPGNPAITLITNASTHPIKLKQIVNNNRTSSFPESNCLYEIGIVDIFFIVSSVYSLVII